MEAHRRILQRKDLIEPDLSYEVVGILFRVFNELGPGLQERYYQKAITHALKDKSLPFREQVPINVSFAGNIVGKYFADFIIDDKIVVEVKKGVRLNRKHAAQVLAYLKATGIRLGILTYFTTDGVFFKRILNSPAKRSDS